MDLRAEVGRRDLKFCIVIKLGVTNTYYISL